MDDFVIVTGRKGKNKKSSKTPKKSVKAYQNEVIDYFSEDASTVNVPACIKEVESIRSTLRGCTFFHDAMEELRSRAPFQLVVALGIGCIHASSVSQYQYAFILEVHSQLQVSKPIEVFDPVMDSADAEIVSFFHNTILTVNEMGKRTVDEPTLFFMPHCSFDLYNAVLWSNWGSSLSHVTLIGNSFSKYDSTMIQEEKRNHPSNCVFRLLPHFEEYDMMEKMTKEDHQHLRYLFESFHSTCILYLSDPDAIQWDARPYEPECGGDVSKTVNEDLIRYMKEKSAET